MLIVLVLISSTLLDALKIKDANLWWFYFGFLISAALHPILMFVGYHALEVSIQDISNWADILNEETSKTRDEALDEIKTASEKMFISQTNPSTPPPN